MPVEVSFEDHGLLADFAKFPEHAMSEMYRGMLEAQVAAQTVMQGPLVLGRYPTPHPNRYPKEWRGGIYVPWSPPGTVPTTLTGALRRSITIERARPVGFEMVGEVGPRTDYAWLQEVGGFGSFGGLVPRRPYVSRTAEILLRSGILGRIFGDAVDRMLRM